MIRLNFDQILTPCIIEFHAQPVDSPQILQRLPGFLASWILPSITVTECWNTTLHADACTCKDNYVLLNHHEVVHFVRDCKNTE